MVAKNLIGNKYGKLTVVARATNTDYGRCRWWCVCDCGISKKNPVTSYDLERGKVRSCGCLYKESNKGRNEKHGHSGSRIHRIWLSIKNRCGCNGLENYAGRGITICDEWKNSFQAFYDWAMANGYRDDLTIDRIDNDKGYSPDNCRWATMKTQENNRRNNRIVTFQGIEYTVAELADILEIPYQTLLWRINKGWERSDWGIKPNLNNRNIRRESK